MNEELREHLVTVTQKLKGINYINNGGCALVALAIKENIRKTFPRYRPKVIYIMQTWAASYIRRLNNNEPMSCSHAVLKVGDYYVDSDGIFTYKELREVYEKECYTFIQVSDELTKASLYRRQWNSDFHRPTGVPQINSILNTNLSLMR